MPSATVSSRLFFPASAVFGTGGEAPVGLCNLDEDGATLAIEAGHELLARSNTAPQAIGRLILVGAAPELLPTIQLALGIHPGAAGAELHIEVHAPRAGTQDAPDSRPAYATARLGDPHPIPGNSSSRARLIGTPDQLRRLVKAEGDAVRAVPMGAYVPRGTWDATLEARCRLLASVCDTCHAGHHPPLAVCPVCRRATRTVGLWKPGRLYSWTTVASGPSEFDPWLQVWGEYTVAIVEHELGIRLAGILLDADASGLHEGQALEPVLRRLYAQDGSWRYGVKFRPAEP